MTKEQILAMEPGRELDALMAEKVMEWTLSPSGFWYVGDWQKGHFTNIMHYPPPKAYENCDNRYFKPSSRIKDAWEVVEKMKKEFRVDLVIEEGSNYCAILGYGDDNGHIYESGADTAPEAICKAALLALGEVKEREGTE